jgi:hypothetical protein
MADPAMNAAACLCIVLFQASLGAINVRMGPEDIRRATELARFPNTDADRNRFHSRYIVRVKGPAVEYFAVEAIEVITPFRRLELIAEDHARINDLFARGGIHDAEAALAPWRNLVTVVAHVQFDQTKIIVGVPELNLAVEGSSVALPIGIKTSEVYSGSGDQRWLVGGLVEAQFDVRDILPATQAVVVGWQGKEVMRARIDFGAID